MTPLLPLHAGYFILNILLQIFDGLFTYHVISHGMQEANPIVRTAIVQWGALWGLLYWKGIACLLLACIFALRHRRGRLTIRAFKITGAVYGCLALGGMYALTIELLR